MYNRRLLPSMASSSLLSPAVAPKPCTSHCKLAARSSKLHPLTALSSQFPNPYSSYSISRSNFDFAFHPSSWECRENRNCGRCEKCIRSSCRDCAPKAGCCVRMCASPPFVAFQQCSVGGRRSFCAFPVVGIKRDEPKVCALLTSVASAVSEKAGNASSPSIMRPSVTWGIIPHPAESSQKVFEFLESEGIDTSELHDVELPTSVEVMQERLVFLKKLGLSIESINSYPLMVTCSIKKNLVPVLDYLEQLGLRATELPAFLEKYPMVLHASVVIDLLPVVDYLLGLDIQRKDISRVLVRYPDVLGFRLEGTMSTSVAYLVSIGVRTRSIGRMLTEYPEILGMRVANTIKPKVDFLLSYGMPKMVVAKILEARPYLLGFDLSETMQPVVNDLLEAGVRREGISSIITQYPDILGQSIRENLDRKTGWLVNQVKVELNDVPMVLEKLPQILFIKEGLAMERVRYFICAGFSAEDVASMVTRCPQILALSISHVVGPNLDYLLNDMKRSPREVVKFPDYFTYDLKSRIIPRHKLIAEKGVECSLEWFLNCTEQRFRVRLSVDYIHDEEAGPVFQMGGVVFTETLQVEEFASTTEQSDLGFNQQVLQQAGKKDRQVGRGVNVQRQRRVNEFETGSDSDFEGQFAVESSDDEEEDNDEVERILRTAERKKLYSGTGRKPGQVSHERVVKDIRAEDDDTDDAAEILQARLQDDDELDMSETASEFDFEESKGEHGFAETGSEFEGSEEDVDDEEWDDEEEEEEEKARFTNRKWR